MVGFNVEDITEFSHHSCLSFILQIKYPQNSGDTIKLTPHIKSFIWNESQKDALRECMSSNEVENKLESLFFQHKGVSSDEATDTDILVANFSEILSDTSQKVLNIKKQKKKIKKGNTKMRQEWYDGNCHNLKKNLRNLGSLLSKFPNDIYLRHLFFAKKKEYKRTVKKQKRQFHNSRLNKIELLSENNPKDFWKLVNSIKAQKPRTSHEILPSEWFDYFKNLNKININTEVASSEA